VQSCFFGTENGFLEEPINIMIDGRQTLVSRKTGFFAREHYKHRLCLYFATQGRGELNYAVEVLWPLSTDFGI